MRNLLMVIVMVLAFGIFRAQAQTASSSDNLVAQPIPDRTVNYCVSDTGVSMPIIWGLDLAWLSEDNIRRGIAFMGGEDKVDIIRSSFITSNALLGDTALQGDALTNTNLRLNIIKNNLGANTKVVLNCDHPSVNSYFIGDEVRWAKLIEVTTKLHEDLGLNVISVSPFNEPDYGWGQYTGTEANGMLDFYNICGVLRANSYFDDIRICGGNTLNCDRALPWYDYLKGRLDEGNTHQLAGSFDNYAGFFEAVSANGDHATADELHNVMEAMVGVEYGMQTGIWWGTAEYARGEFCKASDGKRLGYAEHRPNWTAASVYRAPDGKIQVFGGTSERQAVTTTYRFFSKERDVFYDGHGPQREYIMVLPGGTGYQSGQTNAERVVNVSYGDDIQPVINGKYVLVNRNSKFVIQVGSGSTSVGASLQQSSYAGATHQQWEVTPVDSRVGGDFSYFTIKSVKSGLVMDILNFSLENNGSIVQYTDVKNGNQQWYLEYVEDGWFYIRSRHSAKCIDVLNSAKFPGATVVQYENDSRLSQQWRLIPVGADVEFIAPTAPLDVVATANGISVKLEWTASPETDVAGYTIFRSDSAGGAYNIIARNVTSTSFVDNTVVSGSQYFYVIKSVDKSLNSSDYSDEVSATATGAPVKAAHLLFNENTLDSTQNLYHGASYGSPAFVDGNLGSKAISLDGTDDFVQLPTTIANHREITIATWVYWRGGLMWQRIFDFGNGESEYMFLTPRSDSGLRFAIKNGGSEQHLNAPVLSLSVWSHIVVTISDSGACMYVNGELVDESADITISPDDFKPALNYIGRSQFADPLFRGHISDFRVYNYALSSVDVEKIYTGVFDVVDDYKYNSDDIDLWPMPVDDVLNISNNDFIYGNCIFEFHDMKGRLVLTGRLDDGNTKLIVSNLPNGIYLVKIFTGDGVLIKKVIVRH